MGPADASSRSTGTSTVRQTNCQTCEMSHGENPAKCGSVVIEAVVGAALGGAVTGVVSTGAGALWETTIVVSGVVAWVTFDAAESSPPQLVAAARASAVKVATI